MRWDNFKPAKLCNFGPKNILDMRAISIDISDLEYQKFGLKADRLFSEFLDIVSRELSRQNLATTVELAKRYGLSNMTMDEISQEVKAVRNKNADHS